MANQQTITLELQALNGALTIASNALGKIQGQCPPGPPNDPTEQKLLSSISDAAAAIQQMANAIAKNGGTGQ